MELSRGAECSIQPLVAVFRKAREDARAYAGYFPAVAFASSLASIAGFEQTS
jgi:hypothetical protein